MSQSAHKIDSQFSSAFATIKAGFAGFAAAFSVDALQAKFEGIVHSLASLDDAAEMTGASVESLSSILNTLRPSGASLETVTEIAGKLTKALQGADVETSKAAEAFKALGVETRDAAGNLRPIDDVLTDLAYALNQYADGTNKTALAQAVLGKTGAQYLPLLKDLANTTRDAASVTTEQAAEAERLEKAFGRLHVESDKFAQSLASKVIPVLADLVERFNAAGKAGLGFLDKILFSALTDSRVPAELQTQVEKLSKARSALEREEAGFKTAFGTQRDQAAISRLTEEISKREVAVRLLLDRYKQLGIVQASVSREDLTRFEKANYGSKPEAPSITGEDKPKKTAMSEGERYLRMLEDQSQRLKELSEYETVLADIERGRVTFETVAQEKRALAIAKEIDAQKELTAAKRQDAELQHVIDEAEKRDRDRELQKLEKTQKLAEKYRELGDPMQKYLEMLREIDELQGKEGGLTDAEASNARSRVYKDWAKSIEDAKAKSKDAVDFARDLGITFESAFEKAVFGAGKFSDALKGLLSDISRIVLRKTLLEPLIGSVTKGFDFSALLGVPNTGASQVNDSVVPFGLQAGKSVGAGPMIVQHMTFGSDVTATTLATWGQSVKAQTIAAVKEMGRR